MKQLIFLLLSLFYSFNLFSQDADDKLYLQFDFMHVEDDSWDAYMETEDFWSGIHQARIKDGKMMGWDLWAVTPGGQKQGAQYVTVNLYSSLEGLLTGGGGGYMDYAKKAYPKMTEKELEAKFAQTSASRDIMYSVLLERIAGTEGDFDMPVGTVASMDFMKALDSSYEEMETKLFQPWHQEQVNNGEKGSWGLLRVILPVGSDTYMSHMTVNMFKDAAHMAKAMENWGGGGDFMESTAAAAGVKTRDMKMVKMIRLIKKVR